METVICPKNGAVTEAYAVAAHEFSKLFNMESPIDRRTFAEMQRVACLNFKMDKVRLLLDNVERVYEKYKYVEAYSCNAVNSLICVVYLNLDLAIVPHEVRAVLSPSL